MATPPDPSGVTGFLDRFDLGLPLERAGTIPASWYLEPAMARAEHRSVFGTSWQAVGRADQLTEPGSFVTADVAGEPVVVVRDLDGTLRGFSNVCRHRAARVVAEPCGVASRLRCRYHGWTYDLAGRLRGVPEFDGVVGFDRDTHGLPELPAVAWGPFVWVDLGSSRPLAEWLDPLPARVGPAAFAGLRFVERREYEVGCNWKVFVDNYLDGGYHLPTVHPGLAGVTEYTQYRTEVFGRTSVQTSPLRAPDPDADPTVGSVRSGEPAQYWWVYPNFMINLYAGVMDTNLVLPLGPDRCRVVFEFYFADTDGPDAQRFIADSIAVSHQIQAEDADICADVQRGLGSRTFDAGRFSVRREAAGYHFHRLLALDLRRGAGG